MTGRLQQLTTGANPAIRPSWSPDGIFIAFASKRTQRYGVYITRADGTDQPTLLATPEESAAPQWVAR